MMRRKGPMPTLSRKMSARRFLFFDTETTSKQINPYTKNLEFRLGHAVYMEYSKSWQIKRMESYDLETPSDFLDVLAQVANGVGTLYCVAHNLAFDMQTLDLPFRLHEAGYKVELPTLSFVTTLWRIHKGKASIHFLDSANLFPGKLADLGKDIDLPKYAIDPLTAPEDDVYRYCRRDVMILVKLFQKYLKWLRDENLGYFGETLSWQAFNAYRTRFYGGEIEIHEDYVVLGYEREAYHGARTECFYIGKTDPQDFYLLDVNSMYGFVMASKTYPVELQGVEINVSLSQLAKLLDRYYVIAECEVNTNEAAYPLRTTTKLVFPIGHFSSFLHHSEISYALGQGHIQSVGRVLLYERNSIFAEFVAFFYNAKQRAIAQGDKTLERVCKLMLNSLSGRMGQRDHHVFELGKATHQGIRHYVCRSEGSKYLFDQWDYFGRVFSSVRAGEKPYSCPSIAGAITAYGRMYLWELIKKAGKGNVYYCDTDSILVNASGMANLSVYRDDSRLGFLKCVSEGTELQIFGPKDYSFGLQTRRKGFQATANTSHQIKVLNEHFERLQTAMKRGHHGSVEVREVTKERRTKYDKGRVHKDGTVTPWELPKDANKPVFGSH